MRLHAANLSSIPAGAYRTALSVRSYETTSAGVISPATALRYLEHVATLDSAARGFNHRWYEAHNSAWVVRDMRLLLWELPMLAQEVHLATWLSGYRRVQATREYCLWQGPQQRLVARAQGRWAYVDRERGLPTRIPDELIARFGVAGDTMPQRVASAVVDGAQSVESNVTLVARSYEADTQQHINNTMYMDWLSEALALTLQRAEAPSTLGPPDSHAMTPRYFHIQYVHPARAGDRVRIVTRVSRAGSRRLAVTQDVRDEDNGQLVVECHSDYLLRLRQ
jgi:medium-chain acyl-[acyl-carrier-protein] hydrolase